MEAKKLREFIESIEKEVFMANKEIITAFEVLKESGLARKSEDGSYEIIDPYMLLLSLANQIMEVAQEDPNTAMELFEYFKLLSERLLEFSAYLSLLPHLVGGEQSEET
ncbi:MAG: hypothetical protein ACPLRS_02825 [Hydrogenobacter sp.]